MGLVSENHVWVMPVLTDGWWKTENQTDCTVEDIRNALLTNVLFVDPYPWDPENNTAESGRVCVCVCVRVYVIYLVHRIEIILKRHIKVILTSTTSHEMSENILHHSHMMQSGLLE